MTYATILPRPAAPRAARFARTAALARTAAPLLLAALAACGGSDGPAESGPSSIRLTYSASGPEGVVVQGTYEAQGDPRSPIAPITQTFALGRRSTGEGTLEVMSNVARSSENEADFASVTIPRLTVGSVAIEGICPGETCAAVSLALAVKTNLTFSQARYSCYLDSGTIRVTAISDDRAKGTFSGTGACLAAEGFEDLEQFTITGGTFDVKVRDLPG